MRIDPAQVFTEALMLPPIRFIAAWAIGAMGCFFPLLIGEDIYAFQAFGFIILTYPFYLLIITFSSGTYIFVAMIFALISLLKIIHYTINDNDRSDLYIIFTSAYIATLAQAFNRPIIAILPLPLLIYLTYRSIKNEEDQKIL